MIANGKGAAAAAPAAASRVNDFAFRVATVNGTGSASANGLILKCIYRMGIPVSGKNVFPSNIQGLPTWYELRVSKDGYLARTPKFDLTVAMNPATYQKDVTEVQAGGWILYDDSWPLAKALIRPDVTYLGVPLARMCVDRFKGSRERILMKNIAYAGALAALIGLDMEIVKELLKETYSRKPALLDSNYTALALGYDYAQEHFGALPLQLQSVEPDGEYVMMDGNTAAALGCVYAGATVGAWYPITPATSLMDNFRDLCKRYRTEPDGSKRYVILQAEDELAAAGMVVGAAWMGARAFTPTAGPGIDLMSEFIGLAYYTEIPCVFFDVQRTGPSTGMPTRTQQGDMTLVAYASHGDTKHIVLFPADPGECFYLAVAAFDLAERFQTPVFVLSDLDIGMNDWRIPRLRWDESYQWDRGKVFGEAELAKLKSFSRYLDVDGDGIAARTLPGVSAKGAYFTRGSGHDKHGRYTEDEDAYQEVVDRLVHKLETVRKAVPAPIIERREGAVAAIVCAGSSDAACREAIAALAARGHVVDYMRVRAFPFSPEVEAFLAGHQTVFVVDQNRDGQLRTLLVNDTSAEKKKLHSVRHYSGTPLSAVHVLDEMLPVLEPEAKVADHRVARVAGLSLLE
ncbi:MAG: 2-oxoacid:acceptor oxidoreductase subunit alpha [Gemmatimonadetes bacterium]|nr:2-oxoacid:acceptor oxidoreductase subunit alpha [Gemmatimonadota bacterium]